MPAQASRAFEPAPIIPPIINATRALETTVEVIVAACPQEEIREYLTVSCQRTTPESLAVAQGIEPRLAPECVLSEQRMPFIGCATRFTSRAAVSWS